jgi:hypothetical protein
MPSNLANMGISFNPVYMIREQFKDDMLLKHGLVDLKTGAEVKAQRQFDSINQVGNFLTKNSRHQKVQDSEWEELGYAGRRLTWATRYKPLRIDKELEITQAALDDPMSPVSQMLAGVVKEDIYRTILAAAAGAVETGNPGATPTSVSAANDGVITVDGTSGWTRAKFSQIIETLLAQKFRIEQIKRAGAFISPTMNTAYMSIDSVINRLYSSYNQSAVITQSILDTIPTEVVFGKTGDITYTTAQEVLPITTGDSTVRHNVLLMPDAMAAVVEDMELFVNDNPTTNGGYVDEKIVFARYRIGAMRKMGQRVLLLDETVSA